MESEKTATERISHRRNRPVHMLRFYLWSKGIKLSDFALAVGEIRGKPISQSMISLIMRGERFPNRELAGAIMEATKGAVAIRNLVRPEGTQARRLRKLRSRTRTATQNRKRKGQYAKMVKIYTYSR